MRWRRLLLSLAAVALLGVTGFFLFLWLTAPPPGVYSLGGFRGVSGPVEVEESFLTRIRRWLNSPATYIYHEERPYFTFAIAAGVLALLLWLYRRSWRLYWRSLLALVLLVPAGFALFLWLANLFPTPAPPSGGILGDFPAVYHEERSYLAFAITAGVLALLLLLYRKRLKLSSSPDKAHWRQVMRRRRLLLVVGTVALLGTAGFALFLWLTSPTPGASLDNFRRLRKGVSETYVETVLGKPEQAGGEFSNTFTARAGTYTGTLQWRNGNLFIAIQFKVGRAWDGYTTLINPSTAVQAEPLRSDDETFLDRVRRWLRL
jgi:hypothetical protein